MVEHLKVTNKIQIVLQKGGFAGDLITALYDPSALINLDCRGKINLYPERTSLQNKNTLSLNDKNNLLDKHKILSVCDTEFALFHKKKTIFLYSSTDKMTEFFCQRFKKYHPLYFRNMSITEYILEHNKWRDFWIKKFKNILDVSPIFHSDFLKKIPFLHIDEAKIALFKKWRVLNNIF